MSDTPKRILGRIIAEELATQDIDKVAGGARAREKFTLYPTNGGSDDTQLTDH